MRADRVQFFPVGEVQFLQYGEPLGGQGYLYAPAIFLRGGPADEPQLLHAIDETDCAVVCDLHLLGEFAHRRPVAARVTLDRQQYLILLRRDAVTDGGSFAKAEKFTQCVPELGEQFIIFFG